MIKVKSTLGPNPYVSGTGIVLTFAEFEQVNRAIAVMDNGDALAVADTAYALRTSIVSTTTGQVVRILIFSLSTVAGPGNAWTQLAAGDFSGRTFTVIADGE